MFSPDVDHSSESSGQRQSKVLGNASNTDISKYQHAFSDVEFNVTLPDIDFLSPSTFNEDHSDMPTPKEFVNRRRNSSVKLDDEGLLLLDSIGSLKQLSAPSRSSHNRSVGYTMHLSDSNDLSLRKQEAANKVEEFDKFLHQL